MTTTTLLQYVTLGGVACIGIASAYQLQLTSKVRNAEYFKEAMRMLNEHKASDALLGKPIAPGYIDVFSGKNYASSEKANLFVPLKGSKAKGELSFSAVKNGIWQVTRVELEMKDDLGGKVLIFNSNSESD